MERMPAVLSSVDPSFLLTDFHVNVVLEGLLPFSCRLTHLITIMWKISLHYEGLFVSQYDSN